jgi:hypothetical protein
MNAIPKIVYKYRNWNDEKHKDVLLKNQLYLSSPKQYNDPFDCRISKDLSLLDTEEKINEFVDMITIQHFDEIINMKKDVKTTMDKFTSRLKGDITKEQEFLNEMTFKAQDEHYGILSLSVLWNNILMWGHYGENHKGICYGFNEEKLRIHGKFGKGGLVNYKKIFPKIDPLDKNEMSISFEITHTKNKDWAYEKEYRLQKIVYPNKFTREERIIVIPNECFTEIIIGLFFPENDKKIILENADQKKIPVYQIKKVPFKFKLTREKLN